MSKLFQDSGGDEASRNREAGQILFEMGLADAVDSFEKENERSFVSSLVERFDKYAEKTLISPKQLFWLRDLKERYL